MTLTTNARPDSVAPEARRVKRFEKLLFRIGLGNAFLRFQIRTLDDPEAQRSFFSFNPDDAERAEAAARLRKELQNREAYRAFIEHRAFTSAWWDQLCFDSRAASNEETPRRELLDPDTFVDSLQALPRIPIGKARRAVERDGRVRASDGTTVTLQAAPPRYLWRPRAHGILPGGLERLETFVATVTL